MVDGVGDNLDVTAWLGVAGSRVRGRRPEVGGHFQNSAPVEWGLSGGSYVGLLARRRADAGYRSDIPVQFLKINSGVRDDAAADDNV